ncbi:hypothetical protein BAUCODRAFT_35335 [Baudoinia panamericana UAMH 10762]|uniref:Uncharacterized protein n=1 Tax=Baudoinia panamericana (strain UAMH 10762) TaxID=717646 RepID=M2N947_BAUPA|nr:uncharacterized protein BAUCODRAFT_35335 [Baudoinia panamericana UAMH 10762]EMC95350.1 hypothetical protein BAUCODRAFT_35335 [Baudoinia panamericana UAMH 10762]
MSRSPEIIDPEGQYGNIVKLSDGLAICQWLPTDDASSSPRGNNKKIRDDLRDRMPHPYINADAAFWVAYCQDTSNHVRSEA